MAKLRAHKRRRHIRLRRLAVVLLVVVALAAAAVGIVTLRIRSILLSVLRKQLPNCEITVGRVTLNPFSNLTVYDLKIEDRSNPEARSTIELERVTADFSLAAALKFDVDLDVPGPQIVLHNIGGDSPPFADLYAKERKSSSDRFLIRRLRVRDCTVTVYDPDLEISTRLEIELTNPGRRSSGHSTRLKVLFDDLTFEAGGFRTNTLAGSLDVTLYGRPVEQAAEVCGAITIGGPKGDLTGEIEARLGVDGTSLKAEFGRHEAEALLGLFRRDGEYRIPFIHDFEELSGMVNRLALVVSHDPAAGGLRLDGEIEAVGLDAESSSMGLEIEGGAITMPFRLASTAEGGPTELSVGDPGRMISAGRLAARRVIWSKYSATHARGSIWMRDNDWWIEDLRATLYSGKGWGTIHAFPDGRLEFNLRFDDVDVEPLFTTICREGDQITGTAEGSVALMIGIERVEAFNARLDTKPPGGTIKLKEKEKSFDEIPGGEQVLEALKQRLPTREYQHFLDKFKNYTYESIHIDAGMSGEDYVLDVKIRDRDEKNPLPVDLTIQYVRKVIIH